MRTVLLVLVFLVALLVSSTFVAADEVTGYRLCAADYDDDGYPQLNNAAYWEIFPIESSGSGPSLDTYPCDDASFPGAEDAPQPPIISYFVSTSDYFEPFDPMDIPYIASDHDCDDTNPLVNPSISYQTELNNAFGYDQNCDGSYFYYTQCRPDKDGDGFGSAEGGFEVLLGVNYKTENMPGAPVYTDDPVIACNSRHSNSLVFSSDSDHSSSIFNPGAQYLEANEGLLNPHAAGVTDPLGTPALCEATEAFEWVENTDEYMCEGAVDCEALANDGNPSNDQMYGCGALANYCEGRFSCEDLGENTCGTVQGCVFNGFTCQTGDRPSYLEDLDEFDTEDYGDGLYFDAEVFYDCDHWFAEDNGVCEGNAPAACQTKSGGQGLNDEAPSCAALSGLNDAESCFAIPGCEWAQALEVSSGPGSCSGTVNCFSQSTTSCPTDVCTLSGGSTSCGWDWSEIGSFPSSSYCQSQQLHLLGSGSLTTNAVQAGGDGTSDSVGCSTAAYEAGCVPVEIDGLAWTPLGAGGSGWFYSNTNGGFQNYHGFARGSIQSSYMDPSYQVSCDSPGTSFCGALNSGCDNWPMCESTTTSASCGGGGSVSCSGISNINQCNAASGCTWTPGAGDYNICAQRYALVPDVIEPRIDCDDNNASQQVCPEDDILSFSCFVDNDEDGFYSVVETVLEGEECNVGVLLEDIEGPLVPDEATSIPGWDDAPLGGNRLDADDNDPRETYIDCPAGEYFVWPEAGAVFNSAENDYPRDLLTPMYNPKYFGGCCSGTDCMFGDIGSADLEVATNNYLNCRSSGYSEWTIDEAVVDESIVCSPGYDILAATQEFPINIEEDFYNVWLDADTHPAICESLGRDWILPGHSVTQSRIDAGVTFTTPPGEYSESKTKMECCGDDSNERTIMQTCEGSTTTASLCAPDDGNEYRILDGELVLAEACPDLTRAPPVYVRIQGDTDEAIESTMTSWDSYLEESDLYCCTEERIGNVSYPLCSDEQLAGGCFIADSSLPPDATPTTKEWCEITGTDPHCVIDGSYLEDTTETVTETYTFTGFREALTSVLPGEIAGDVIDGTYNSNYYTIRPNPAIIELASYDTLDPSCTEADVSGCVEDPATVVICNPTSDTASPDVANGATASCFSICEHDYGNPALCELYCAGFTCEEYDVYYGPACTFEPGCKETKTQLGIDSTYVADGTSLITASDCNILDQNGELACALGDATFDNPDTLAFNDSPSLETIFGTAGFLEEIPHNILTRLEPIKVTAPQTVTADVPVIYEDGTSYCVPNGETVQGALGSVVCLDPNDGTPDAQNFGDYWCPIGFAYDPFLGVCIVEENLCDAGEFGSPDLSCADTDGNSYILGNDDPYFGQYNAGCVEDAGSIEETYDAACCLAATFNNFEVYTDGNTPDHVRIY